MRPAGPSECRCRARPGRASEGLGELVGVLGAGRTHIGAADLRLGIAAALPVGALDALAGFQILVDLEEVLDLQAVELRDVGQLLATHLTAVTEIGRASCRERVYDSEGVVDEEKESERRECMKD